MKIFEIGFDVRSGYALHRFFSASGLRCVHWDEGRLARKLIDRSTRGLDPIPPALRDVEVFGGLFDRFAEIDCGDQLLAELDERHPGSRFILPTLPLESLLPNRSLTPGEDLLPAWIERQATERAQVIDLWRRHWENRLGRIREHFRSRPRALLVLDLEDDPATRLVEFLAGEVALDPALFPKVDSAWPREALPERREDVLEEVVFINLDRRLDRRRLIVRELLQAQVPRFIRFPAIDGDRYTSTDRVFRDHDLPPISAAKRLKVDRRVEQLGWNHRTFRAKAGCWVSHLRILDECRRKSASGWTVVCEDDVRFLCSWSDLVCRFQRTLAACPGVELVALSSKAWQRKEQREPRCAWSDEERDGSVLVGGTDCYAVSHRAAGRIISASDPSSERIERFSLDGHLSGVIRDGHIAGRGLRGGYWAWCWGRDFTTGKRDTDIEPDRERIDLPRVELLC